MYFLSDKRVSDLIKGKQVLSKLTCLFFSKLKMKLKSVLVSTLDWKSSTQDPLGRSRPERSLWLLTWKSRKLKFNMKNRLFNFSLTKSETFKYKLDF